MTVQIIKKDGQPEWAVVPYETYQRLIEDAEMLQDIREYDQAKRAIDQGEELVPGEVVYAILDGESPIRVWRKHRGITQRQLAEKADISAAYLSQIELGERKGSADVLAAIARALDLTLDDIVES